MKFNLTKSILNRKNQIAILIDPEKFIKEKESKKIIELINKARMDFIFVGGSTCSKEDFRNTVRTIKKSTSIPIILFPGDPEHISNEADALLFLCLISGRNPYYLIESQIEAAELISKMKLKSFPTSYLLIDGGINSSVLKKSKTEPIQSDNLQLIYRTALAGKLLGQQIIYLEAGSGAKKAISDEIVKIISKLKSIIIVGGGIRSVEQIKSLHESGANIVVIGNHIEENPSFLNEIQVYKNQIR